MKSLFKLLPALLPLFAVAQNVGIGTVTPTARLEVNAPGTSTLKVSSQSFDDSSELMLSNRFNVFGTDYKLTARQEQGLYLTSNSDLAANRNDSLLTILTNGNIGIANKTPAARLDVNGPVNVGGQLRVNGDAGTAGQVLTSNGTGSPLWKNTALTNNTRFGVIFNTNFSMNGLIPIYNVNYNTSTDVTASGYTITINKTGLYHFSVFTNALVFYSTATTFAPTLFARLEFSSNVNMPLATYEPFSKRASVTAPDYRLGMETGGDFYLQAGTTANIPVIFDYSGTGSPSPAVKIEVYGYLISD